MIPKINDASSAARPRAFQKPQLSTAQTKTLLESSSAGDRVSLGGTQSLLESSYGADGSVKSTKSADEAASMENMSPTDKVRALILEALRRQGLLAEVDVGDGKTQSLETMTPEEAQALVAEDGYWGVEQTSDRMFNMMTALAGGDPARLDAIKAGIEKGFESAKQAFGGSLPDISYRTRDRLLQKLDEWAASASPSSDNTLAAAARA